MKALLGVAIAGGVIAVLSVFSWRLLCSQSSRETAPPVVTPVPEVPSTKTCREHIYVTQRKASPVSCAIVTCTEHFNDGTQTRWAVTLWCE